METIINELVNAITEDILRDLESAKDDTSEVLNKMIFAYNTYQESEHDGVDYMFNLLDRDDLKCCIEGGLEVHDIARLYYDYKAHKHTPYFFYGQNHKEPKLFETWDGVKKILSEYVGEVVVQMIAYPQTYDELYDHCVTCYMENNSML